MTGEKIEMQRNGKENPGFTDVVSVSITPETEKVVENCTSKYHLRDGAKADGSFQKLLSKLRVLYTAKRRQIVLGIKIVMALLYFIYFGYALSVRFGDEGSWRLTVLTIFGVSLTAYRFLAKTKVYSAIVQTIQKGLPSKKVQKMLRWSLYIVAAASMVVYLVIFVVRDHPENLISLIGLVVYLVGLILTSTNMSEINWHTVFWGMTLQFFIAIFFLKTDIGVSAMNWTSKRFEEFTKHADAGSEVVFGPEYGTFRLIFKVLTYIVLIDVLTYLGVTHFLTKNIGGALSFCMGTKAPESMVAVANIFIGTNVSMLLARKQIPHISLSQVFCMLVAGLSSMSGTAMLTFRSFGIPIKYLLLASVLSAPAALVSAKISLPEGEDNDTLEAKIEKDEDKDKKKQKSANNIFEAMAQSLKIGGKLISTIILNILFYVALGSFIDGTLQWIGERINLNDLTFERISSYVFWPLPYIMGASPADCGIIAEQIGLRTLINVGLAYINFGQLINNRESYLEYSTLHNDTVFQQNGDVFLPAWNSTLTRGFLTERSELIGVYALCGFASLKSMGISLGIIQTIAPKRVKEVATVIFRAYLVSTVASFVTACMAGLVYV